MIYCKSDTPYSVPALDYLLSKCVHKILSVDVKVRIRVGVPMNLDRTCPFGDFGVIFKDVHAKPSPPTTPPTFGAKLLDYSVSIKYNFTD